MTSRRYRNSDANFWRSHFLDQGCIVEDGTHEELRALGGLYARYWERQSGGFIGIQDAAE